MATVAHTFQSADDEPERGLVTFRPLVAAVDDTPDVHTVTAAAVNASLDANGSFMVDLTASDDAGWRLDADTVAAGGMPYTVSVWTRGLRQLWTTYIPAGTWDLMDLVDLGAPPEVATVPVPGPVGPAGPPGDPTTLYVQPAPPVLSVPPTGFPLWLDTDEAAPPLIRVTHPNVDDVLVQAWDAGKGRWQVTHYDSGWRNVTTLCTWPSGWSVAAVLLRRVGPQVLLNIITLHTAVAAVTPVLPLGAGFQASAGYFTTGIPFRNTADYSFKAGFLAYGYLGTHMAVVQGVAGDLNTDAPFSFATDDPTPTSLPGTLHAPAPALRPEEV